MLFTTVSRAIILIYFYNINSNEAMKKKNIHIKLQGYSFFYQMSLKLHNKKIFLDRLRFTCQRRFFFLNEVIKTRNRRHTSGRFYIGIGQDKKIYKLKKKTYMEATYANFI